MFSYWWKTQSTIRCVSTNELNISLILTFILKVTKVTQTTIVNNIILLQHNIPILLQINLSQTQHNQREYQTIDLNSNIHISRKYDQQSVDSISSVPWTEYYIARRKHSRISKSEFRKRSVLLGETTSIGRNIFVRNRKK